MFTGIIEEVGKIQSIKKQSKYAETLSITCKKVLERMQYRR